MEYMEENYGEGADYGEGDDGSGKGLKGKKGGKRGRRRREEGELPLLHSSQHLQ